MLIFSVFHSPHELKLHHDLEMFYQFLMKHFFLDIYKRWIFVNNNLESISVGFKDDNKTLSERYDEKSGTFPTQYASYPLVNTTDSRTCYQLKTLPASVFLLIGLLNDFYLGLSAECSNQDFLLSDQDFRQILDDINKQNNKKPNQRIMSRIGVNQTFMSADSFVGHYNLKLGMFYALSLNLSEYRYRMVCIFVYCSYS